MPKIGIWGRSHPIDKISFINDIKSCSRFATTLPKTGGTFYLEWLRKLRDPKAKVAVTRRVNRIELGNFGDHKPCREGVWELRIDQGPGYRVYYARSGSAVILLLSAGDKRTQDSDIDRAIDYWRDWQSRNRTQEI